LAGLREARLQPCQRNVKVPDPVTRGGSLLTLYLAVLAPGCIFAEPPERKPQQTPVFFDLGGATPLTTRIVSIGVQDVQQTFRIPILSEDAGEEVWWVVHENLTLGGMGTTEFGTFEPSTISDTTRFINFSYKPAATSDACVQLTLMACHRPNFEETTDTCTDHVDTAFAVWWINFQDLDQAPSVTNCPQSGQ
jgi:hypothetical protein